MSVRQMNVEGLVSFVRKNGVGIIFSCGLSLVVVVAALILYMAFAPCSERYAIEIQISLESRDGIPHYPNGDCFSARDIISAPVLNRVWKKYGLATKAVRFEDFCHWFGIVGYDKERAKIDAEFQNKLSKRNITVTELTNLQRDYEARLGSLASNRFMVSMSPGIMIDREMAVKMLNDIPEIWFSEYSKLKGPLVPAVSSGDAVKSYLERVKKDNGRVLELFDFLRIYAKELKNTCAFIRVGLMSGRNAWVDGIDIGTYESQLEIFDFEWTRMKYKILTTIVSSDFSEYIDARLEDMACEQKVIDERIAAVTLALDAFGRDGRRAAVLKPNGEHMNGGASGINPVTVQADSGFFSDFAAMVRRDANQEFMRKFINDLTEYRKQLADISARKLYYDQIVQHLKANAMRKEVVGKSSEVQKELVALSEDLLQVGEKIVSFRDKSFSLYRTSNQFYEISALPLYGKNYTFPLLRFLMGLLALWMLYNIIFICYAWRRE